MFNDPDELPRYLEKTPAIARKQPPSQAEHLQQQLSPCLTSRGIAESPTPPTVTALRQWCSRACGPLTATTAPAAALRNIAAAAAPLPTTRLCRRRGRCAMVRSSAARCNNKKNLCTGRSCQCLSLRYRCVSFHQCGSFWRVVRSYPDTYDFRSESHPGTQALA